MEGTYRAFQKSIFLGDYSRSWSENFSLEMFDLIQH